MFKTKNEIIDSIDAIMYQALKIVEKKDFDLGIVRVYYVAGTLCLDIYYNTTPKFIVLVNISNESFSIIDYNNHLNIREELDVERLLPINSLKIAFIIYEKIKGNTYYKSECFNNSCLRHFEKPLEINVKFENKILSYKK
jgi:hypothetical protein